MTNSIIPFQRDKNALVKSSSMELPSLENSLYLYLREINKIPSLTQEEEFLLAKAYLEQNDIKAAHRLVTSHLKLVAKIALSYRHYGLPLVELISEGNIGLMHSVKKYNPDLGYRLSTYSIWWIKATIQEYILRSWSLVKIGTTSAQKKLFFTLNHIKKKIASTHFRNINDQDYQQIAENLNTNAKDVANIDYRLSHSDISLNQVVMSNNYDEGKELIELLPETRPNQEVSFAHKEENQIKRNLLLQALSTLNERELYILQKRKLIDNPLTLEELSSKFNISKERIRQIENRAFTKVQEYVVTKATQLAL